MDGLEQVGIKYLKIEFDEIFNMSNVVITSLHDLVKKFSKDGIFKVPNENVLSLNQQINYVRESLSEAKALPRETPVRVLIVLTRCSVPDFFDPLKLMLNTDYIR